MVESNKKALWLGLGAAGALIAAALLYHYASADDDDDVETPQVNASELMEELKKKDLGEVKRNENGIEPQYFIKLLQFIGETNKTKTAGSRAKHTAKRREHYKKEEWDQYEEVVRAAFQEEDMSAQTLLAEVCDALSISQMEF